MHHKTIQKILIGSILVVFGLVVYLYRWIFYQEFDPVYFKHFYDHSQWSIPSSSRIMGDGELYQYAGYRLLRGDNPFSINPEAPPLGKYVYAVSIGLFNNAYFLNPALLGLAIVLIYLVAKRTKMPTNHALLCALLFAVQPIIFSQIGDTAFELIHINLLLTYILLFLVFTDQQKASLQIRTAIVTGIILGAFTAIRFGLFSLALIIPTLYVLIRKKQIKHLYMIVISACVAYLAMYFRFFALGYSFLEWLKNQKWILDFYLNSNAPRNPLLIAGSNLFGLLKTETGWHLIPEWTIVWTIGFGLIFWKINNTQNQKLHFIKAVLICMAILLAIVPFGLRYIALIVPLYLLVLTSQLKYITKRFSVIIVAILVIQFLWYVANRPFRDVDRINQLLENNRFEDLYRISTHTNVSGSEFSYIINNFLFHIQAEKSTISVNAVDRNTLKSKIPVIVTSNFQTPIGEVTNQKAGYLQHSHGRWQLVWDWEFIAPNFGPQSEIIYRKGNQIGGRLITADNKILSEGTFLPFISVIPHKLLNEEAVLKQIKLLTKIDPVVSRVLIHVDYPQTLPKRLGHVAPEYSPELLSLVATQSGVIVSSENGPHARKYPQGAIDQKLIDAIREIEKTHTNLTHYIPGSINIKNNQQEYQIYTAPAKLPEDVILDKTIDELFGPNTRLLF